MATKAPGQRGKRKVVDVGGYDWAERPHPRTVYRIIKAPEDLGSNTRRDGDEQLLRTGTTVPAPVPAPVPVVLES